jgi:hypothetical protein
MIYYLFENTFFAVATKMSSYDPGWAGYVINWPPGSVIRDTDPRIQIRNPKEIPIYGSTTMPQR